MTDGDRVFKVELIGKLSKICDISVHVIPAVGLAGTTVAAPVMRNDPVALFQKEHQLIVPIIRAERPAVAEGDWLRVLGAPILIEDLVCRLLLEKKNKSSAAISYTCP